MHGPPEVGAADGHALDALGAGHALRVSVHADATDESQSQQELDESAYSKAWVAECKMRRTYVGLMRKLAANPSAIAKLEDCQRKWLALTMDDERAHFPNIDERGYYGSVLPMCLGIEEEGQSWARADELNATALCHDDPAGLADAREASRLADVVLNDVYQKVQPAFAKDRKFTTALTKAQRTWITYRDAQAAFAASASGSPDGTCAMRELARVTKERSEYLRAWLAPEAEGDVCAGSHGPP